MTQRIQYAALPLRYILDRATALGLAVPLSGSYLAQDAEGIHLDRLLDAGFRWTRTEGDLAVFEREVPRLPGAEAARCALATALRALTDERRPEFDDAVAQIADLYDALGEIAATGGAR